MKAMLQFNKTGHIPTLRSLHQCRAVSKNEDHFDWAYRFDNVSPMFFSSMIYSSLHSNVRKEEEVTEVEFFSLDL